MKTLLKIASGIVVCVALLLVILRFTGFEPGACPDPGASWTCRVPGLWLRGNLVTTPVTDWSFTDQYQNAKLQTTGPFGIPHSIGTYLVSYNGQLYLTSVYAPGLPPYPHGRRWNENVARDPHVRIKIGDNFRTPDMVRRKSVRFLPPVEGAQPNNACAAEYPGTAY
jgi:hypothetical protein